MVFAFDPVALQLPTGFLQVVPMAHKAWIMAFQLVVLLEPLHRVDVESDQDRRNILRHITTLVGQDGPPGPIHQFQVVIKINGQWIMIRYSDITAKRF